MRKPCLVATVGAATLIVAAPAQAASPVLIVGLLAAAGIAGTAVAISASQQSPAETIQEPARALSANTRQAAPMQQQSAVRATRAGPDSRQIARTMRSGSPDVWGYSKRYGWIRGTAENVAAIDAPLALKGASRDRLLSSCRKAVASTARSYDLVSLEAVSAGRRGRANGRIVAPVEVRAVYAFPGGHEVRRTMVRCELDRSGRVKLLG
jgi:hypothetical protein